MSEEKELQMTDRTEHVYAGAPDARQSMDPTHAVSRFRPTYRPLTPEEKALHDAIKAAAVDLESLIVQTPSGRAQSLAMTHLEDAIMWAIKGLTA